ncbi:hypothetical protein DSUL_20109 [Desulfovibrionales bacterium]
MLNSKNPPRTPQGKEVFIFQISIMLFDITSALRLYFLPINFFVPIVL